MEATAEGLNVAANTRQALKRRRDERVDRKPPRQRIIPLLKHNVEVPEGFDVDSITLDSAKHGTLHDPEWRGEMAKQYPFKLDPFQQAAVACLERHESVMVAAHTSAGKTAVAEYAIAMAQRDKQRIIYTSPLKALSNQKYRELAEEFGDVGLMTGDVTINTNAECVVMTTEILRSMLYRGSELLREVAWVIFDEVHYMQDRERGVVWEESIIFLPHQAHMVFLSATLANASEFAAWVASLHRQPCHIVYTDYRPTLLQHFAFPVGGQGMYSIKDEHGNFKAENFAKLRLEGFGMQDDEEGLPIAVNPDTKKEGGKVANVDSKQQVSADVAKLLKMVRNRDLHPVIVFSFSRRDCESYGRETSSKVSFNSAEEEEEVVEVFNAAMQSLSEVDRNLEPVTSLLPMLKRGIGVHHSGLLPILKELVELLFQTQLVKCLFATETFAMGLNMPAKTVIFTTVSKFDGTASRWLTSGEYVQMSGRAGRRGMDDFGVVVVMLDDKMNTAACRHMVSGAPGALLSSFKLSYYTLLNLLRRVEGSEYDMEFVIAHSFQQFQFDRNLPKLQTQLEGCEAQLKVVTESIGPAAICFQLRRELADEETRMSQAMLQPHKVLHFLRPGRLVKVREGQRDWGWGVLLSVISTPDNTGTNCNGVGNGGSQCYTLDVLLPCAQGASSGRGLPSPGTGTASDEMLVIPVELKLLSGISSLRLAVPSNLLDTEPRQAVLLQLRELQAKYREGLPRLDPIEDLGLDDLTLKQAVLNIQRLERQLATCAQPSESQAALLQRAADLRTQADGLRSHMNASHLAGFREEVKARMAVLEKLEHIDKDGMVRLKGRAACEIDTADELLTMELMLNGVFNSLDKHQLVALVSCLVPSDKSDQEVQLIRTLAEPLLQLQQTAKAIGEVQQNCKLPIDPEEFAQSFKPDLMDVIYQWSKGATFEHICTLTDAFEGSIVRATRRLDELMSQLQVAARVLGDEKLADLFDESVLTIRRDIMFAASLFV